MDGHCNARTNILIYIYIFIIGDPIPAHIPKASCLRVAKSKAIASTRLHPDPILSLNLMKSTQVYGSTIRDIGLDKFFVHFWSHLQLKIYR